MHQAPDPPGVNVGKHACSMCAVTYTYRPALTMEHRVGGEPKLWIQSDLCRIRLHYRRGLQQDYCWVKCILGWIQGICGVCIQQYTVCCATNICVLYRSTDQLFMQQMEEISENYYFIITIISKWHIYSKVNFNSCFFWQITVWSAFETIYYSVVKVCEHQFFITPVMCTQVMCTQVMCTQVMCTDELHSIYYPFI